GQQPALWAPRGRPRLPAGRRSGPGNPAPAWRDSVKRIVGMEQASSMPQNTRFENVTILLGILTSLVILVGGVLWYRAALERDLEEAQAAVGRLHGDDTLRRLAEAHPHTAEIQFLLARQMRLLE